MARKGTGKVRGLFTALLTPFERSGRVDLDRLGSLVNFQISKGVDGIYACGSTGLGPLLSIEERQAIAETVISYAGGKVPAVVQVGCADTPSTIKLARHAEKAGAYAIASLTPFYYKPGEAATIKHFESVASSVNLPLFAYNIPQFTGNNLLPKTVASLANKGTIAGVKDSHKDVMHLLELLDAVPEGFVVMTGAEEFALFAIMMGADGVVSGGANAYPELFHSLVSAFRAKDFAACSAAQKEILAFKDAARGIPLSPYYEILSARGHDCGVPRAPFLPLKKGAREQLLMRLRKLGLPVTPQKERETGLID